MVLKKYRFTLLMGLCLGGMFLIHRELGASAVEISCGSLLELICFSAADIHPLGTDGCLGTERNHDQISGGTFRADRGHYILRDGIGRRRVPCMVPFRSRQY